MEQAEFTTENIKYDLLGMHETLTARGFNKNQIYSQIKTQLNTQGYDISQEDLESTVLETKSQLKRYQNHTREMFEYQDKLLRYFKNATEKEKTKEDAMFVVQRDFRKATGYDLKTKELEYILTNQKPEYAEEPLKGKEFAIWEAREIDKKSVNEISLSYQIDPLYIKEATRYWRKYPNEKPVQHKEEIKVYSQSRESKKLTINIKSKPKVVSEIKAETRIPVKIPDIQIPLPKASFPQREGILEKTAKKFSEGLNRAIGFFLARPAYIRC